MKVALVDGIVMGGGAGLSMQATFCVVTENTVFAMPEASIGLFPDVGASKFLSKLPGAFGEYLALTGARLNGGEMLACGLASHFVLSKELPLLEKAMCEEAPLSKSTVLDLLNKFAHNPNMNENSIFRRLEIINRCFSRPTVEEIFSSLENEIENNGAEKWIEDAMRSMRSASPTSLKITLKSIRKGRTQDLEQCLTHEYTVFCNMLRGSINRDFFEGSRAILFDKDKKAKWDPPKLELVADGMVDKFFTSLDGVDPDWVNLRLPIRLGQTRSRARL
ncbi:probable 3-hydroxyisobutyryl-CoA hydrolase 2 [Eucalyptus grandis]|uniref:probable 3-hydroxyisobutyryl-CoA hydrolase 2 n=1 Tax=Eucalyptus grandis TaxID=71139 RepID=UPI00192E87EA|nr:probable 3-hydroxyisobutyryl-CoA hydrolase 2 [Eucalyptus grandis]